MARNPFVFYFLCRKIRFAGQLCMKQNICISDYDYPLPEERIAKFPLERREQSKLLLCRDGRVSEDRFFEVGKYLPEGSLLVFNNTKVIRARLVFYKETGARIEIFCLEPHDPADYERRSPPKEVLSGRASSVT